MNKFSWPTDAESWDDLFKVLAPFNKKKDTTGGKLFEQFCIHYLKTNYRFRGDFKNVWHSSEVPIKIIRKLNLEKSDHGYDFIVETKEGKFAVGQCKFTNKQTEKTLGWSNDRLSSWLAAGSRADIMFIFTNASGVSKAVERKAKEKEYYKINYERLMELDKSDLKAILNSISGRAIPKRAHFKPRPHQKEAIKSIASGFSVYDRGKLIFPCGAGKTLTSLWVKEKLKPKKTLILVPSLSLIRQFKNDWKTQEKSRSDYFCVCSDLDNDSSDAFEASTSEIIGKVTTDAAEIRRLLKKSDNLVVYSTYQSSPRIAEAMKGTRIKFDLIVCDEAHRTAGSKKSSPFTIVHENQKIPSSKRLYMTATPRIVSDMVKNRLGEEVYKYLADMNDESTFGPEFMRMTFADAIKEKVLVDYKIIAVGVSDKEVRTAIKKRKLSQETSIDQLSHNIALDKAKKKYKIRHAITFHSSIKKAEDFKKRHLDLWPKSNVYHVSSKLSARERSEILSDFASDNKSIITNSKCLTEGVDISCVDCVYFCDPKQSEIDIVQAAGRAMRLDKKNKGKIGYIIVPIFHSSANKLETSISQGEFRKLVRVVRALADHDGRIEEEIKSVKDEYGRIHISEKGGIEDIIEVVGYDIKNQKLAKSLFFQKISQKVVGWRDFEDARKFAKGLGLKNKDEWYAYVKGQIKGMKPKPIDIPSYPNESYDGLGWKGYGDWLGTGNIANFERNYREFEKAKKFAINLKLTSSKDWYSFCRGEISGKPKKPDDIPSNPYSTYRNKGWRGWGDWLGTGTVATRQLPYRSFEGARQFVHKLNLKNGAEWKAYCKGELKNKPAKPSDIPLNASRTYKDSGWKGMGDWLGTGRISNHGRNYKNFKEARAFVRALNLNSIEEWKMYCRGEIANKPIKPLDIPGRPERTYKLKGWKDYGDWLGTGRVAKSKKKYRSFSSARTFARSLKLKNQAEWFAFCKGEIEGKPEKPEDISGSPHSTYKNKGWKSWGDWLGTGYVASRERKYRSFTKARSFARKLNLKGQKEWFAYCRGELDVKPSKPDDIPVSPSATYKNSGWESYGDWLGTGNVSSSKRKYREFEKAREFAQSLNLKNSKEWASYCRGELKGKPKKPEDITGSPQSTYKEKGWKGWGDWLGTDSVGGKRDYREFEAARKYARNLKLKTPNDWKMYCGGKIKGMEEKPVDIPKHPNLAYKDDGWKGMLDWLGISRKSSRLESYRKYEDAKSYVNNLGLKNITEWHAFCRGDYKKKKPKDIPSNPNLTYKDAGWNGYGDWLGTGRIPNKNKKFREFKKARAFVRSLKLKNSSEWVDYCAGKIKGKPKKPIDIPSNPSYTYKNSGWKGYGDWLGTGTIASKDMKFRTYDEARKFVIKLKLKSETEWRTYRSGKIKGKPKKPSDIPSSPEGVYKGKGWKGWRHFLGNERKK